ncbi:hypothetical protein, partial [uncultured Parasutterella sp.]|uniref:hypothetical protein n=1 Tax=uncultured Parasutterella sp. TaxID=1263098 RepID=UPI002711EADA
MNARFSPHAHPSESYESKLLIDLISNDYFNFSSHCQPIYHPNRLSTNNSFTIHYITQPTGDYKH